MDEALFKTNDSFIYIQNASDGGIDYTIYSKDFRIIDGGRLDDDKRYASFKQVAAAIVGMSNIVKEVAVDEYYDLL